jgi:hypothetical protein
MKRARVRFSEKAFPAVQEQSSCPFARGGVCEGKVAETAIAPAPQTSVLL